MDLELPELASIDLDGPVAYRSWTGPAETTFVLVHGLGGSHLNWVQVAPGLAGLGRVLALDLPGFGYSPRQGRPSGIMDLRRTLGRFIEELGRGQVVLCGSSMGGGLGILHAAIEPDSLGAMVLTGSVFPKVRGARPHPVVAAGFVSYRLPRLGEALFQARMRGLGPEQAVRLGLLFATAVPASIPPEVVALNVELVRERQGDLDAMPAFLDTARSLLRLSERPDVARRALDHVTCPVLVLHGRRDRLVPAAFAEAELRRHPAWRGRIFPDLGHVPMMEAPGRWLVEVADWYPGALGTA
jgi:pimeloyl-ACP methyl ester carboxylesterase